MGLWNQLCRSMNGDASIEERVDRKVADIRRAIRATHPDPSEAIPHEVMRLKNEIRITCDEGGSIAYREALYMWKIGQRLYPGQFTEADKPNPVT